jgi:hypothetical protein
MTAEDLLCDPCRERCKEDGTEVAIWLTNEALDDSPASPEELAELTLRNTSLTLVHTCEALSVGSGTSRVIVYLGEIDGKTGRPIVRRE